MFLPRFRQCSSKTSMNNSRTQERRAKWMDFRSLENSTHINSSCRHWFDGAFRKVIFQFPVIRSLTSSSYLSLFAACFYIQSRQPSQKTLRLWSLRTTDDRVAVFSIAFASDSFAKIRSKWNISHSNTNTRVQSNCNWPTKVGDH